MNIIKLDKTDADMRLRLQLLAEIGKRQKQLGLLSEKVEQLKLDLLSVKHLFDQRVGKLYLRLNELELNILKLRQVLNKLKNGNSREQADSEVELEFAQATQDFESQYSTYTKEQAEAKAEPDFVPTEELKTLWRRLVTQYHPDLVQEESLKKQYTEIMKRINKAFKEGDVVALQQIAQQADQPVEPDSIVQLKDQLKRLHKAVRTLQKEQKELKMSEWYEWKTQLEIAQGEERDVFQDLAEQLESEIQSKETIFEHLNESISDIEIKQ